MFPKLPRKYFGSLPVLTILTPKQAAKEGLLGLAYGGAFLSGALLISAKVQSWVSCHRKTVYVLVF